jgi:flagellar hook assembly protein FlgD
MDVFDAAGRRVKRIEIDATTGGAGVVPWDGRDDHGIEVASGVYWVRLRVGSGATASRMIVVRK